MTSELTAPPLTVWLGSAMYTFPPGRDITVGRSRDCDICLDDAEAPGYISRTHAVLRFEGTGWVAVDRSRAGIFADSARVGAVDIRDGRSITLGRTDGPRLTFRITATVPAPTPAQPTPADKDWLTPPTGIAVPPRDSGATRRRTPSPSPSAHPAPHISPPPPPRPVPPSAVQPDDDLMERVTSVVRVALPPRPAAAPPGATTIGRATTNTIVVDDALASRVHAIVQATPAGMEIRDNGSSNGTFVNSQRITAAPLSQGDVVTVGNTDLVVSGTTLMARSAPVGAGGLAAHSVGLAIDGHQLLDSVSFTAGSGTLTAVIGPSGAGKSTLIKLLAGTTAPSAGIVSFDGRNVHLEYASLRSRIGLVPQDDVVHSKLTVEQALDYAAELRLPPDTSAADRRQVVDRILGELELVPHKQTRVDKLSGGQRKRTSVAMELLTGPSLLILDEPTSGLDPALDRQVMTMLRGLAQAGRVVAVVTHSLTYLDMCDQVLLLAPGGKTAFAGPPAEIGSAMGTTDWADIFARVSADPDGVHNAYLARHPAPPPPVAPPAGAAPLGSPPQTSLWRQISTVARRQARVIAADRAYFIFLAVLPFILGALPAVTPGSTGLGYADPRGDAPDAPSMILLLLNVAAVFMGTALTIRDLVGERSIFQREQAVGLSASAYLAAKVLVYSVAAALQTAIITVIVVAGKGAPTHGAVLLGNGTAELYVALAATTIASAMVGLVLSSLARSTEQILPMLVVAVMISVVFAGGMMPMSGRAGLEQISWLLPARWGFAASASTVDLRAVMPIAAHDPLWSHSSGWWLIDMGMLTLLGGVFVALIRWRLRLPDRAEGAPAFAVGPAVAPRAPTRHIEPEEQTLQAATRGVAHGATASQGASQGAPSKPSSRPPNTPPASPPRPARTAAGSSSESPPGGPPRRQSAGWHGSGSPFDAGSPFDVASPAPAPGHSPSFGAAASYPSAAPGRSQPKLVATVLGPAGPARRRRLWVLGAAALLTVVVVVVVVMVGGGSSSTPTAEPTTSRAASPPRRLGSEDLKNLLLPAGELDQILSTSGLDVTREGQMSTETIDPAECAGIGAPATEQAYPKRDSAYRQSLQLPSGERNNAVDQAVIGFNTAEESKAFVDKQNAGWTKCAYTLPVVHGSETFPVSVAAPTTTDGVLTISFIKVGAPAAWGCQRALTARDNVVVDTRVCNSGGSTAAATVASKIAAKTS